MVIKAEFYNMAVCEKRICARFPYLDSFVVLKHHWLSLTVTRLDRPVVVEARLLGPKES